VIAPADQVTGAAPQPGPGGPRPAAQRPAPVIAPADQVTGAAPQPGPGGPRRVALTPAPGGAERLRRAPAAIRRTAATHPTARIRASDAAPNTAGALPAKRRTAVHQPTAAGRHEIGEPRRRDSTREDRPPGAAMRRTGEAHRLESETVTPTAPPTRPGPTGMAARYATARLETQPQRNPHGATRRTGTGEPPTAEPPTAERPTDEHPSDERPTAGPRATASISRPGGRVLASTPNGGAWPVKERAR
jgi:hypothetical protein